MRDNKDNPERHACATSHLTIRRMMDDDISRGMELKQAAGWNQTLSDWQRFLTLEPNGCFVASAQGLVVGTIVSCLFGSVAWIGMLLVDDRYRRAGIATRLMDRVLMELDHKNARSIRLDATPMGMGLYDTLGFRRQFRVVRFGGIPRLMGAETRGVDVQPYRPEYLEQVLEHDRQATQVDRSQLIRLLLAENGDRARVVVDGSKLSGFMIARPGSHAVQIGPVVASSEPVGRALILDAANCHREQICYVDVPEPHAPAGALVRTLQLSPFREFTRMCRGVPCREQPDHLWAGSGPEKG